MAVITGAVIAALVVSAGVYGTIWNSLRNKIESKFNSAVAEMGFSETENGVPLERDKLTDKQAKLVDDSSEMIEKALSESMEIYDRVYM